MDVPLGVKLGWRAILKRTMKEMFADGCFGMAAELAYYFLLSLFPALLIIVALTSFFPGNVLDEMVRWFGLFTPPDILSQLMLAVPLWLLYELGLLAARFISVVPKQDGGTAVEEKAANS